MCLPRPAEVENSASHFGQTKEVGAYLGLASGSSLSTHPISDFEPSHRHKAVLTRVFLIFQPSHLNPCDGLKVAFRPVLTRVVTV